MTYATRIPTSEKLAQALIEAGAPRHMIDRAKQGIYDDYRSPLAFPLQELVNEARAAGLASIAERAMAGEFDGQGWEAEAWAASPEGQSVLRTFVRGGGASDRRGDQDHDEGRPEGAAQARPHGGH